MPQDAYTSTEHVVIKVAEALNITVEPEDIEISRKIYRGKANENRKIREPQSKM